MGNRKKPEKEEKLPRKVQQIIQSGWQVAQKSQYKIQAKYFCIFNSVYF